MNFSLKDFYIIGKTSSCQFACSSWSYGAAFYLVSFLSSNTWSCEERVCLKMLDYLTSLTTLCNDLPLSLEYILTKCGVKEICGNPAHWLITGAASIPWSLVGPNSSLTEFSILHSLTPVLSNSSWLEREGHPDMSACLCYIFLLCVVFDHCLCCHNLLCCHNIMCVRVSWDDYWKPNGGCHYRCICIM